MLACSIGLGRTAAVPGAQHLTEQSRRDIGDELNPTFRYGTDYQSPRYAQLKVKLDF